MRIAGRILGGLFGLPAIRTPKVRVQRDLAVPVRDGALLADRHLPAADPQAPLVLMRTPYGRKNTGFMAGFLAERGYQVVIVSVRGTSGSTGRFRGWHLDRRDTEDTLAWLRTRPWFPGAFATWGASFLGYTQWDLAAHSVPEWKAAVVQDAPSGAYDPALYSGGAFSLGDWLWWAQSMAALGRPGGESVVRNLVRIPAAGRRLRRSVRRLPVTEADLDASGERIDYYRDWLRHPDADDPHWSTTEHRRDAPNMPPAVHLAGGWNDIFLSGTVADAKALRDAGRDVRLLIGPWAHGRGLFTRTYMSEAFAFLDHALRSEGRLPRTSTKVHVSGADVWREVASWPPEGFGSQAWYLNPGGGLSPSAPRASATPRRFRFDPADPTPPSGEEAVLNGVSRGSLRDHRALEAREDVLVYTGAELTGPVEVCGPVSTTVHTRADGPSSDVVVRLYDVPPKGRAVLVSHGVLRLDRGWNGSRDEGSEEQPKEQPEEPQEERSDEQPGEPRRPDADGVRRGVYREVRTAEVAMRPAAHLFRRGHRIRVHVCGGAFPLYDRNLGTSRQLDADMRPVTQEVLSGPDHPSAVHLTVDHRIPGP